VPALFDLPQYRSLPSEFSIIAVDPAKFNEEKLRRRLRNGVKPFSRQGIVKRREWSEKGQNS
jgi:glucose-6-phosphate 1-dehydrogenase